MKRIIAIAVLAFGVLVWRMGAMNQTGNQELVTLKASDQNIVTVPKNRAILFGTIKNLLEDKEVDDTTNVEIPLPRVSFDTLKRLLDDLNWVVRMQNDPLFDGETAALRLQRWIGNLPKTPFSVPALKARIENLNAASYLNMPELIQKYAKEIANMLISGASLKSLYENNIELVALLDNRSIHPSSKEMIYQYMPEKWVLLRALEGYNNSVTFSGNDESVVTMPLGIISSASKIWNANSGALLFTLTGHVNQVESAQFSPNGDKVVTASLDNTAKIWNAQTGTLLFTLRGHNSRLNAAHFSQDGNKVVTTSWDKTAKIWNALTGELLFTLAGHEADVKSAKFSWDGNMVVTASSDNTAKIWNALTGELLHTLTGHTRTVNSAEFSQNGSKVVTASDDRTAKIWDSNTGALSHTLAGYDGVVYSARFSRDGSKVVTASSDRTAKIWNAQTGELLHSLSRHGMAVESAVFSPDDSKVATASFDTTARIWDANTGALLYKLEGHTTPIRSVAFSLDGTKVITSSTNDNARVWQLLPQSNLDQALFIQLLAWATHNKKSISFTGLPWAEDTFNSYDEANKTILRTAFPETLPQ